MIEKKLQTLFFSLFNYIVGVKETWIYSIW